MLGIWAVQDRKGDDHWLLKSNSRQGRMTVKKNTVVSLQQDLSIVKISSHCSILMFLL